MAEETTPGGRIDTLNSAYRYFGYVKAGGAVVSGLSVLVMMLFIVWDVIGRNLFGASVQGGFEIVQNYFMPLSVFPALGYVYASGILPKMDLVMPRTSARFQRVTTYVLLVLELSIFALLVYFTWGYAVAGMGRGVSFPAGTVLYPVWPLYFLVPLGFTMILVETGFVLVRNILTGEGGLAMQEVEHVVE